MANQYSLYELSVLIKGKELEECLWNIEPESILDPRLRKMWVEAKDSLSKIRMYLRHGNTDHYKEYEIDEGGVGLTD